MDITNEHDLHKMGEMDFPVLQVIEIADELKDISDFCIADILEQINKKDWSVEFKMYMSFVACDQTELFGGFKAEILRTAVKLGRLTTEQ